VALGLPRNLETNSALAFGMAELATHGLDASFYDTYVDRVMAVTAEDVQRVANRFVRPRRVVVVIVGDLKTIEPTVRALNLGPRRGAQRRRVRAVGLVLR
jgi:predicted Zn-dependent peptidase